MLCSTVLIQSTAITNTFGRGFAFTKEAWSHEVPSLAHDTWNTATQGQFSFNEHRKTFEPVNEAVSDGTHESFQIPRKLRGGQQWHRSPISDEEADL